ncbi:UDP-rhamnose/UDP-galactose transporter 2-like [Impatiens glandulifera]|uniref:UDP-rhamnose/UDP-galactose transporter 2-like n=1 Tax=Impatiens glandulifera TaxID=253017 RepID=UPI001FB05E39|nr:UDP-rhamnose/UDP-galactose transporter 2-like [Impatiens glandulifera]
MAEKDSSSSSSSSSSSVSDVGAWAMNVISSVSLIMANKQLMSAGGYGFTFATTLTGFHFTMTALIGLISKAAGYSESTHIPFFELLWFSLVANMSIAGMNFSLMLNSVGFYQISKLSMIPVVCVMEWILNGKHYTKQVKSAVVIVVAGVGVCTVTDVNVNGKGFFFALAAVLSTSFQQISIGSLQKKYSIGSFELLSKTAPIQAISLIVFGPFLDSFLTGRSIFNYRLSYGALMFILLSCLLAVFCNMSQYLCIGRFSAVSFQVLGHMKTVFILVLGWLLFDSELTMKNVVGVAVVVVGMVLYSWAVEAGKQDDALKTTAGKQNSLSEDDVKLLSERIEEDEDDDDHKVVKDIELGQSK